MKPAHTAPLALLIAAGLLAACASQPASEQPVDTQRVDTDTTQLTDEERLALLEEQPPVSEAPRRDHRSRLLGRGLNVTVYTEEDLRNTGRTDLGEALRMLDPRFQ